MAANLAVFVYVLTLVDRPEALRAFYDRWSFHPFGLFGALSAGRPTAEAVAPLITHQFLHAGWLHIAGNLVFLWVFGAALEGKIGRIAFLVFYLAAGCVAALAQGAFQLAILDRSSLVGASGAISGVLGAYIVLAPLARVRALVPLGLFVTPMTLPAVFILGEWFVLQVVAVLGVLRVVGEAEAHVAYFAHVGGFVFGLVLFGGAGAVARLLRRRPARVAASP